MRTRHLFYDPFGWILLLMLVAVPVAWAGASATRPERVGISREVLAFYYGWWGTPAGDSGWQHWQGVDSTAQTIASSVHYPVGGAYDSHDAIVVGRQMAQMRVAGITGVISSWWGRGGFDDRSLDLLMRLAPAHDLAVTAYYETMPELPAGADAAARVDAVIADLDYLLDRHGGASAWLKVAGRPVVFVFGRAVTQLGLDGWWLVNQRLRQRSPAPFLIGDVNFDAPTGLLAGAFAGIHNYNNSDKTAGKSPAEIAAWAGAAFPRWVRRWRGRLRCLTIFPSFGNATITAGGLTERHGGATYRALAEQAIAADPDWLLVTSWNEWHESTEIEPSIEQGDTALRDTREIAAAFRASEPRELALARH